LTRQLLTYSRRERLRAAALELNHVVVEMTDMLRRMLGPAIRLELRLSETPLRMEADVGLIEQVVMNLAINAREVMPDGGVLSVATSRVELTADGAGPHPPAGPGAYACLAVSDTGPGIPADVLPHVFEPFFTTKEPGRGTGLGLATVYGAAQQHRGAVEALSEPGRGAEFRVWLPLSDASEAAPVSAEAGFAEAAKETVEGGGLILVVDDEEMVREMAAMALCSHGYEVVMAEGGAEALKLWPDVAGRVALLFTDLLMPGISGQELARRVLEMSPGLPVVYSSGFHDRELVREMHLKEGVNFVGKPYSLEALIGTVRRSLAARG
jgi:CheY-like chemotaxis protein